MTTVDLDIGTSRESIADGSESSGRARFSAHLYFPTLQIVTVEGDVDATNHRDLGRYVVRHLHPTTQLLLDLRAVNFFGAQGFSALYYISVRCARLDVDWAVVGGHDVDRLLRILDPGHVLPLADDFHSAWQHLEGLVCRRHPLPGAMPFQPDSAAVTPTAPTPTAPTSTAPTSTAPTSTAMHDRPPAKLPQKVLREFGSAAAGHAS
jgi:anti-anti-sigma factor